VTAALRSLAAALALAAMLMRGLLPAGWMPNPDGVAGGPLIICTMGAPLHVHPAHAPQDDSGKVCPFAVMAHLAAAASPVAIAQPVFTAWRVAPPADYRRQIAPRARAYSSRAPPVPV
jgi:hypothetical protein